MKNSDKILDATIVKLAVLAGAIVIFPTNLFSLPVTCVAIAGMSASGVLVGLHGEKRVMKARKDERKNEEEKAKKENKNK